MAGRCAKSGAAQSPGLVRKYRTPINNEENFLEKTFTRPLHVCAAESECACALLSRDLGNEN
jgi:hypothetical protein